MEPSVVEEDSEKPCSVWPFKEIFICWVKFWGGLIFISNYFQLCFVSSMGNLKLVDIYPVLYVPCFRFLQSDTKLRSQLWGEVISDKTICVPGLGCVDTQPRSWLTCWRFSKQTPIHRLSQKIRGPCSWSLRTPSNALVGSPTLLTKLCFIRQLLAALRRVRAELNEQVLEKILNFVRLAN